MNFVCIFRPRITGPWQGAVTELRQRCRAVRRVPPTPVFPHSRADGVSGQPPALGLPDVSEMYLKISAVNLAAPEKMRYIIPGHPASGTYHIASNISAYTWKIRCLSSLSSGTRLLRCTDIMVMTLSSSPSSTEWSTARSGVWSSMSIFTVRFQTLV